MSMPATSVTPEIISRIFFEQVKRMSISSSKRTVHAFSVTAPTVMEVSL